jgi:hypothetical protein
MSDQPKPPQVLALHAKRSAASKATHRCRYPLTGPQDLTAPERVAAQSDADRRVQLTGRALALRFRGRAVWRRTFRSQETGLPNAFTAELLIDGSLRVYGQNGELIDERKAAAVRRLVERNL